MKKWHCFFLILIGLLCIANRLYNDARTAEHSSASASPRATQTWQYILIKPSKEEAEKKRATPTSFGQCRVANAMQTKAAKRKENSSDCVPSLFPPTLYFSLFVSLSPSLSPSFFFALLTPRQHIKFSITNL